MKNKQHDLSVLKHRLREKAEAGVSEVKWKLDEEQVEYLQRQGYSVEPWLYCIITRELVNVARCDSKLLKEIHYSRKKNRKALFKPLTPKQEEVLRKHDVKFYPCKYIVRTSRG